MKLSYVHLYSSCFSIPLATEITNRLQIIFPLIKIDLKSSRDYFSKSIIADNFGGKLVSSTPEKFFPAF